MSATRRRLIVKVCLAFLQIVPLWLLFVALAYGYKHYLAGIDEQLVHSSRSRTLWSCRECVENGGTTLKSCAGCARGVQHTVRIEALREASIHKAANTLAAKLSCPAFAVQFCWNASHVLLQSLVSNVNTMLASLVVILLLCWTVFVLCTGVLPALEQHQEAKSSARRQAMLAEHAKRHSLNPLPHANEVAFSYAKGFQTHPSPPKQSVATSQEGPLRRRFNSIYSTD